MPDPLIFEEAILRFNDQLTVYAESAESRQATYSHRRAQDPATQRSPSSITSFGISCRPSNSRKVTS
jgi:hypothetical protein